MVSKVKRFGYVLFGAGVALLAEKIVNYGASFTYPPILDHGIYGLIMIIISFILLARRESGEGAGARASLSIVLARASDQQRRGDAHE